MKMKDKLVKFGHKKNFYTMKKCVISLSVFAGLAVAASIPLSMEFLSKTPVGPHAETTEKEEPQKNVDGEVQQNEDENEKVEEKQLLSY